MYSLRMVGMQELENRLFSEGLHVFGNPPQPQAMQQYLQAYFGDRIPEHALSVVSEDSLSLEQIRSRLEASLDLVGLSDQSLKS